MASIRCLAELEAAKAGCQRPEGLDHEAKPKREAATKRSFLKFNTVNKAVSEEERESACEVLDDCRALCNARAHATQHAYDGDEEKMWHMVEYVKLLKRSVDTEEGSIPFECSFGWKSHITSTKKGWIDFNLKSLPQELRMATVSYGLTLRECALASLASLDAEGAAVDEEATCRDVVSLLRESSGALAAAAEIEMDQGYNIPSEICQTMARALSQVCLGEAQAVTAFRAEAKRLKGHLVASLYFGVSAFFEEARRLIKQGAGEFNEIHEPLIKYLCFMSWSATARGIQAVALASKEEERVGEAITTMEGARQILKKCNPLAEDDIRWMAVYEKECQRFKDELTKMRKENQLVFFQTETKDAAAYPEAKQVCKAIPFNL